MESVLSMGDDPTGKVTRVGGSKFVFILEIRVSMSRSVFSDQSKVKGAEACLTCLMGSGAGQSGARGEEDEVAD